MGKPIGLLPSLAKQYLKSLLHYISLRALPHYKYYANVSLIYGTIEEKTQCWLDNAVLKP